MRERQSGRRRQQRRSTLDGTTWQKLGSGVAGGSGATGPMVFAIAVDNSQVFIDGDFSSVNGVKASNIAGVQRRNVARGRRRHQRRRGKPRDLRRLSVQRRRVHDTGRRQHGRAGGPVEAGHRTSASWTAPRPSGASWTRAWATTATVTR